MVGKCCASRLRKRKERGVYAASAWENPKSAAKFLGRGKAQRLKRPEGRAPPSPERGVSHSAACAQSELVSELSRALSLAWPLRLGTSRAPRWGLGTNLMPAAPGSCAPSLSTPFHKYDHVCCVDFRFWRGATREHPPQWGWDRGAKKPEPKSDATLRAAVLFGPDVVAHSLQTAEGLRWCPCGSTSRLVWAKNPSPQTWSDLWNGVLSGLKPNI